MGQPALGPDHQNAIGPVRMGQPALGARPPKPRRSPPIPPLLRAAARLPAALGLLLLLLQPAVPSPAAAAGDPSPRWDPQHPDANPGPRPLAALLGKHGGSLKPASFELFAGHSAVDKGTGVLVRGQAKRGAVLLERALSVATASASDAPRLTHFRALSLLNHCWVPNARLLRRRSEPWEPLTYDLVAVTDIDGEAACRRKFLQLPMEKCRIYIWLLQFPSKLQRNLAGQAPSEVLVDYTATPGFIEGPSSSWECSSPSPRTPTSQLYRYLNYTPNVP